MTATITTATGTMELPGLTERQVNQLISCFSTWLNLSPCQVDRICITVR